MPIPRDPIRQPSDRRAPALRVIATRVVEQPRVFVSLALLWTMLALLGLPRLEVDFSVRSFFSSDDGSADVYDAFAEHWGHDDRLLMVIAQTRDQAPLGPQELLQLQALTLELEAQPEVMGARSLLDAPRLWSDSEGVLHIETVADSMPAPGEPGFAAWLAELQTDPLISPGMLSSTLGATVLLVELEGENADIGALLPRVQAVRRVLDQAEGHHDLLFVEAGIPAVRTDFFSLVLRDTQTLGALVLVILITILALVFRSVHGVLVPLVAAGWPALLLFGLMGWTGEPVGMVNQTFLTLLPAIAVADAIHLLTRFHEALEQQPAQTRAERALAVREAVERVGAACLFTSITTGIGLLSLCLARMPVIRSFGLYAAVGISLAYLGLLLVVPILLLRGRARPGRSDKPAAGQGILLACARFSMRRSGLVLGLCAALTGLCLLLGSQVQVDNALTRMLDADHPTTRANQLIDAELGGILSVELDIQGEPGDLSEPAVLQAMVDLGDWARTQDEVRAVTSSAEVFRRLTLALGAGPSIPDDRAAVAQIHQLLDGQEIMRALVTDEHSRGRLSIRVRDVGSRAFEGLTTRIQERVDQEFAGLSVQTRLTGTPHTAYRGTRGVTRDLRDSLILALGLIGLATLVLLRDLRLALICLPPNCLPLVVGYGLLGALGWPLKPTTAMVFTLALGIAVDDTIHLVARWREERAAGHDHDQAILRAVAASGRAVAITSLLLGAGFAINGLASFPNLRQMGALGATAIAAALIADLFLLPALLARFGGPRGGTSTQEPEAGSARQR